MTITIVYKLRGEQKEVELSSLKDGMEWIIYNQPVHIIAVRIVR